MKRISNELRKRVAHRAAEKCEYCQSPEGFSISGFSIEHVTPQSKGGESSFDNLAFACQQCNNHKYTAVDAVDPVSGNYFALFHPRLDVWSEHFAWDFQFIRIVGITGTGRATVARLKLNRESLVNLRRLLVKHGFHP